jgi:hypothetical protein
MSSELWIARAGATFPVKRLLSTKQSSLLKAQTSQVYRNDRHAGTEMPRSSLVSRTIEPLLFMKFI